VLLAFAAGWLTGVHPLTSLKLDRAGFGAGLVAILPLLLGLAWCLRSRRPAIVRLMRRIERDVAPLFHGIGPAGLALIAVFAGLGEETLFRGVLQPWLAGFVSPWPAVVLAAVLFGAMHPVSPTYAMLAGLAGAYFGALVVLTGNLLPPIVAHAGYDFVALLVLARMKPVGTGDVVRQTPFISVPNHPSERTMSVTLTHAPGTFSWADLGTPDPAAAKHFYTGLFGWSFDDRPMSNDEHYTMLLQDGKSVAALYQQQADQRSAGIPPHWLPYVTVESADRVSAQAAELGGTVLAQPFDVQEHGRMAVIQDPTGAVVALWEPRNHPGAGLLGEPGALCWNELCTRDPARAGAFYADLLGWGREAMPMPGFEYTVFKRGEQPAGGMMAIQPEWGDVPPHWGVYFAVEDCDATAASAAKAGGAVLMGPADIPEVGRFATLRDPQGAIFSVLQATPRA
jgi:predicted enzyme related to lactoylglutathione lyase/membrane protease YdiL (CAAX protease family)